MIAIATSEIAAARLAALEPDWDYLIAHGLDQAADLLRFPAGEPWHVLRRCLHPACERPSESSPWLCQRCLAAWRKAGSPPDVAAWCSTAPAPPERRIYGEKPCAVGCERPAEAAGLCKTCTTTARKCGLTAEEYLATRPEPRPGFGTCQVTTCTRMAAWRGVRLCKPHQRQWSVVEGRPDLASWAAKADPVWTAMDEVPLSGLELSVRRQVLVGYQEQLRAGGRLSPHQVKSAIIWLRVHRVDDLLEADLPERGTTTTYLRVWKRALLRLADSPEKARRSTVIRLGTLNPRLKGYVHLTDIQAPWLVHLAQEQAWALAAAGASSTRVRQACYALRWFAYYLRLHHPDQGRTARSVGRVGVMGFLEWFAERARDSEDYQHMDETNPRRAMIAERMLPSLADPTRILLVTAQLHWHYVRALKDAFDRHRQWLHEQGAGDLHVTDEEVPPWPEKDRGFSEEEGRSEDALPRRSTCNSCVRRRSHS